MLKSISSKIISLFVSVTTLAVLISGIIFIYSFTEKDLAENKEIMTSCAKNIARLVADDTGESERVSNSPKDYSKYSKGIFSSTLWIVDSEQYFAPGTTGKWPVKINQLPGGAAAAVGNAFRGNVIISNDFSSVFKKDTISVIVPIYRKDFTFPHKDNDGVVSDDEIDAIIGAVILTAPSEAVDSFSMSSKILLACSVVVAVVLSAAIGIAFSVRFTRPLNEMRTAAAQISLGNYDVRIKPEDKSELSDLAYSLNHLASTTKSSVSKLKNESLKLNNIIDNVSDGLAAFDTSMRLIKYNTALLKICEEDYFQKPEIREAALNVMRDGQKKVVVVEEKDVLKFTITQIKSNEIVEGVVIIVSDISQSERLEQLRREFVANVSHEFRTPLTIIRGSVEALVDGAVTGEDDRQLCYSKIESETAALERLVKDLLDTSRFKAGKITLDIKKVDINVLLDKLTDNMNDIAKEKNIRINYEAVPMPYLLGDYDRLRQLFIIFIDNAIKFTPENGTITVSTHVKDNMAYINIKDTGVGIPQEDIPFLFERFYKVDKARGGSETGTGLGLSIAWQIAELHGGTIYVESEVGKGTLFKILIPISEEQE